MHRTHQLHRILEVQYRTAWFLAHRIREAMRDGSLIPLCGEGKIVEADETYIGRIRGMQKTRGPGHKFKVLSLVERGGSPLPSYRAHFPSRGRDYRARQRGARKPTQTDEAPYYPKIAEHFTGHESVNHSTDEWARDEAHTNTLESFFALFKRRIGGVYQHWGEKHLHRYLAEFDFRYNHRAAKGYDDSIRAAYALYGIKGKRLTYHLPSSGEVHYPFRCG